MPRRGRGSITSYQTKAGTRWRYQLWVPADPGCPEGEWQHVGKGGYLTAKVADDAMGKARDKHKAGVDLTATMPTVADYSKRWLDGLDLEAATVAGYRRIFTLHVNPAIGALRLDKARQALGSDALPALTLHGLRHTHATVLLEAGENPKVVQERLGHTTITTTMDVYSHVTPTMQRSAVDRFTAAVSGTD